MPDLDIFSRKLAPGWRKPYRQILCGGSNEDVANMCVKALLSTLKDNGGCAKLDEVFSILDDYLDSYTPLFKQSSIDLKRFFERLQNIEMNPFLDGDVSLLVNEAKSVMIEQIDQNHPHPQKNEIKRVLVERNLIVLIEKNLIDKMIPVSIGKGKKFNDIYEANKWEIDLKRAIKDHACFEKIVDGLMKDHTAKNIPNFRITTRKHIPTDKLLHIPLKLNEDLNLKGSQ